MSEIKVHEKERGEENQMDLDKIRPRLFYSCQKIYEYLMKGHKLSGYKMTLKFGITETRRRIKDLRDSGVKMSFTKNNRGAKEWYMTEDEILYNAFNFYDPR